MEAVGWRRSQRSQGWRRTKSKRFLCFEENMGEACKRQANWYTEKNWRGKQDENTCGKPGKDGHGRGEGDEGDRLSDLGIYRSGISRNSGNQSWDCRRCEPALLPGMVGMHCRGSGWNRMFSHVSENRIQRRKEELYDSFRDLIAWMHTALRSGYSMENAVLEAAGQLEQSLGKENILVQELRRMRHKMMISVPVEQLFQDLAVRSRIDDIATFASVLVIAKRTGGNVCEIFQNTWDIFCTRIDTMREIRAGVSSRRFEQNIMSVVPFGILGYVQLSFPEFLSVMYGNVIGVFFMSGCLAVYLAAWVLGKKILDIEF